MFVKFSVLPRWLRDTVPLILCMVAIFMLSSRSTLVKIENEVSDKFFFKSSHFIAYATLSWLWWRVLTKQRLINWSVLFTAFALAVLYGVSDEIHQTFVPGRSGQVADVLFDAGGALAMILLIRLMRWVRIFPEILPIVPCRVAEILAQIF